MPQGNRKYNYYEMLIFTKMYAYNFHVKRDRQKHIQVLNANVGT
jgi:hypothetical protein